MKGVGQPLFCFAMQSRPSSRWRKRADDRRCGTEIEAAVWPPVFGQTRSIGFVLGALSSVMTGATASWLTSTPLLPVDKDVWAHAGNALPSCWPLNPCRSERPHCPDLLTFILMLHDIRVNMGADRHRHRFHSTNRATRLRRRKRRHGLGRTTGLPLPVCYCVLLLMVTASQAMTGPSGPSLFACGSCGFVTNGENAYALVVQIPGVRPFPTLFCAKLGPPFRPERIFHLILTSPHIRPVDHLIRAISEDAWWAVRSYT